MHVRSDPERSVNYGVSIEALLAEVWKGVVVTDGSVYLAIN
jgi:hypothetical protein